MLVSARPAHAVSRVAVEIGDRAEKNLEARFTRRLIGLELSDVEVPPDPRAKLPVALFFRVLWMGDGIIRVELWERGQLHGSRSVSAKSNPKLVARRIALAAAELARRLSHQRAALSRMLAAQNKPPPGDATAAAARRGVIAKLAASASGALLPQSDAWLAGPALGLRLELAPGLELGLSPALLAGEWRRARARLQWYELALDARYEAGLARGFALGVDALVAAAVAHVGSARALDDVPGQHETWSARTGLRPRAAFELGAGAELLLGPEAAIVLRAVPATAPNGERERLGGLWLGASVELRLETGRRAALKP